MQLRRRSDGWMDGWRHPERGTWKIIMRNFSAHFIHCGRCVAFSTSTPLRPTLFSCILFGFGSVRFGSPRFHGKVCAKMCAFIKKRAKYCCCWVFCCILTTLLTTMMMMRMMTMVKSSSLLLLPAAWRACPFNRI